MRNLNVAITDDSDEKVQKIMDSGKFKNRADCVAWLIEQGYDKLFLKEAKK